ncbi:hypothetical protein [Chitinilyticum piscinae]|uniref:SH3 domain-containing protein n=1 Tax=Chitinilyticum piscinae TaxID=2866724 RepID=A0A8J7FLQ8_9NEIS|nr:hypothetical protein [Chitinilyticum piscinae]MBE9608641.1 hypothetical protein [Chitinilyticum piscinae]
MQTLPRALLLITALGAMSPSLAADCARLAKAASEHEGYIRPPLSFAVTGQGRLYFHTAPDAQCRSKTLFVIPGDELIAYSAVQGWFSVMYVNPKTGEDASGWVHAERLKARGRIGPEG